MRAEWLSVLGLKNPYDDMHKYSTLVEATEKELRKIGWNYLGYLSNGATKIATIDLPPTFEREASLLFHKNVIYHQTNFEGACGILQSNAIRLYSLSGTNDSHEFELWKDTFSSENFAFYKNHHVLSASFSIECLLNDAELLKEYGTISFEIEIINEPRCWKNFFCGRIEYLDEEKKAMVKEVLCNCTEIWKSEGMQFDMSCIMPFYKTFEWSEEREVRMFYYQTEINTSHNFINANYLYKKQRNYILLPFLHQNVNEYPPATIAKHSGNDPFPERVTHTTLNSYALDEVPKIKIRRVLIAKTCTEKNQLILTTKIAKYNETNPTEQITLELYDSL